MSINSDEARKILFSQVDEELEDIFILIERAAKRGQNKVFLNSFRTLSQLEQKRLRDLGFWIENYGTMYISF